MDFNQLITALITNGIGAVCAAAVLWFSWHRETKSIPKMMDTFASTLDKAMTTFAGVIHEEREVCQRWHEENRQRLDQILVETKENRHYLRDLAHQVGLRKAVEHERIRQGINDPQLPP